MPALRYTLYVRFALLQDAFCFEVVNLFNLLFREFRSVAEGVRNPEVAPMTLCLLAFAVCVICGSIPLCSTRCGTEGSLSIRCLEGLP